MIVGALGQPGLVIGSLGRFGEAASDVPLRGPVDGYVEVVPVEDGADRFGHEVHPQADYGSDARVPAHVDGVVSHFERVGDGHEGGGGDRIGMSSVQHGLPLLDGVQYALQLDVHVVVRHDADLELQQFVQQGFHDMRGRIEEGRLGFREGSTGRQGAA